MIQQNTVNEKAAFLEKAKQKNESNKLYMNRYYEKKRHLDTIALLEKKKPWVVSSVFFVDYTTWING